MLDENDFGKHGLLKYRKYKHGELFSHDLYWLSLVSAHAKICLKCPRCFGALRYTSKVVLRSMNQKTFNFNPSIEKHFKKFAGNVFTYFSSFHRELCRCHPSVPLCTFQLQFTFRFPVAIPAKTHQMLQGQLPQRHLRGPTFFQLQNTRSKKPHQLLT